MLITEEDIEKMEKLTRVQLATSLPGPKPICLVGTRNEDGITNLAPFSSITHLGSNPPLIGMITRPDTVSRHTLQNILTTQHWTLNHVTPAILAQAHQCSARYPDGISEFEATGLTEYYHSSICAPFVEEATIRYALKLEEVIPIPSNNTQFIVGRVILIDIPDESYSPDGSIALAKNQSLASTALDTYFSITEHSRLPDAKAPQQSEKPSAK